jgi:hypothetical protein
MLDIVNLNKMIVGILLGVFSNYTAETLNCETQKYFGDVAKSQWARHVIIIVIIYTSLDYRFDDIKGDARLGIPFINMLFAVLFWVGYCLITKTYHYMKIGIFLLLAVLYILNDMADKRKQKDDENEGKNTQNILYYINYGIFLILFILVLISAKKYAKEKNIPLSDLKRFFKGITTCNAD